MLQVCGRKIVRQVVQLAGLPCFWDGQFDPPLSLLKRAKEYVGILANIMELPQSTGAIELLQGEPIALLLKSIGNALAKSDADASTASPSLQPQQLKGQPGGLQGKGQHADAALLLSGVAAEKLQGLRALTVLMHLLGKQLGTHALQVGVLCVLAPLIWPRVAVATCSAVCLDLRHCQRNPVHPPQLSRLLCFHPACWH